MHRIPKLLGRLICEECGSQVTEYVLIGVLVSVLSVVTLASIGRNLSMLMTFRIGE